MADNASTKAAAAHNGAAKGLLPAGLRPSNGGVTESADIPRARSLLKMRNQSNGDIEGAQRQGVPRRVPSLTTLLDAFVGDNGGDRAIHSILVANNGIGAVKFMRSVRSWAYKAFGSERALTLVAMATPEDMRMDAEHIRLADQFVEVPGGANANNYANVRLIVQVAQRAGVDAVWPGWGHASENPELPTALAATPTQIRFLGPPAAAMAALGDKVGSTIIAQAAGVPTLPWSGSGISIDYATCNGVIPENLYQQACVHSLEEALERCARIGYPIMLKASWGGGGKGIRKVLNEQDVRAMFGQVQGEVPGSPVFAMALAPQSRHLEVQLLCDMHGNVTSVHSRDCSVQRRHQKIVEEGPVTAAPPETLRAMEACARALARAVGYVGAATVEYLYVLGEQKYYFLELNPRLQVEHPVTEMISGVNLPAAQVQIGMGIPLYRIPDVRRLFGSDSDGSSRIDFERDLPVAPLGHVVAVRVTSEDANDGFKPTCGLIEELSFRSTPEVWGYFSVKSGGGIHEFSDSQFGHLFARGDTRTAAVRAMVVALKEVKIRGEIRTLVDYAIDMIQSPEFINNRIHTGWLDSRIAAQVRAEKPPWYLAVIAGAVLRSLNAVASRAADFLGYLAKGQLPPMHISLTAFQESFVLDGKKYVVGVVRSGAMSMRLSLGGTSVEAVVRHLNDGGLLIQVDGQSHVVHSEEEAMGTRLTIDSLTCLLANEVDPSQLTSPSPGKLVRYTIPDGGSVAPDQPYAEVEVMKMFMPMLAPAAGTLRWRLPEGSILAPGDLIATLDLTDPGAVTQAVPFTGGLPAMGPPQLQSGGVDTWFAAALDAAKAIMAGFDHPVNLVVEDLLAALDDPALPLLQWGDRFSAAAARLPPRLADQLEEITGAYKAELAAAEAAGEDGSVGHFPAQELLAAMGAAVQATPEKERAALAGTLAPLRAAAEPHAGGPAAYARHTALQLLELFLATEEQFSGSGTTEQEVIDALRREHSDKLDEVLGIVVAHQGAPLAARLAGRLLAALAEPSPEDYRAVLRRLAALQGAATAELAANAGRLLERSLLGELRAVAARALSGLDMFSGDFAELVAGDAAFAPGSSPPDGRRMTVVEGLYSGLAAGSPPRGGRRLSTAGPAAQAAAAEAKMAMLVEAPAAVEDALASLLVHMDPVLQGRALTTYIRRSYFPFLAKEPTLQPGGGGSRHALFTYTRPHEGARGRGEGNGSGATGQAQLRLGAALLVPSLADVPAGLTSLTATIQQSGQGQLPAGTLHVALTTSGAAALKLSPSAAARPRTSSTGSPSAMVAAAGVMMTGAADVEAAAAMEVAASADALQAAGFDCISVLANHPRLGPLRSGVCWDAKAGAYVADPLLRAVEPPVAELLELRKLPGGGRGAVYEPSRNRQSHLWAFSERADAHSIALKRVFLRGAVRQLPQLKFQAAVRAGDAHSAAAAALEALEPAVKAAMANIERASAGQGNQGGTRADWTHVYLAVLPALPAHAQADESAIAGDLRAAAAGIAARAGPLLRRAAVAQWEVRLRVASGGAWRIVASLPTGHESGEDHVAVYLERPADGAGPLLYAAPFGLTASGSASAVNGAGEIPNAVSSSSISSLASVGQPSSTPGPLAGTPILAPCPPLEALQRKRLAARRHKTTFCYDFPSVFGNALRQAWAARAAAGEPDSIPPPGPLVGVQELCAAPAEDARAPWAVAPVERPIGGNDVGIVAWRLALRTPECPGGREVVAIANDITYNSGSFGPREDAVFHAVTMYALEQRLPLVYLAANSGARVGLASEIKACLQVEWQDANDPAKGFQYLYLTDADHARLTSKSQRPTLQAERLQGPGGETRWRLSDVIGREEGLGVECLSGSGAIASAYNRAFAEGFTVTLVSGRTVGIGAYLARLGRRVVQRADQPVILTGYAALNKLLGRDVYTSHLQLGGPKVMAANGVSHQVVADDLEGVRAVLQWLSFVPPILGGPLPALPSADPADRPVTVSPAQDGRLDARLAIAGWHAPAIGAAAAGAEAADEGPPEWQSGMFDRGSWVEAQAGWARTVITGRARLGGTPVGVIAVESATVMLQVPADPGMPDSSERTIPQAGQVWFPDSAAKTAAAMQEFDAEGLPLFVLANWRGFSGGQRDLFEGVLQAGSLIVDALRTYRRPAFVYLPPGAELRGGAWVVIDSAINPNQVEMYADTGARGGVLEPEGMVEIKFRAPELRAAMARIDPVIRSLKEEAGAGWEAAVKAREEALLPVYRQVAVAYAAMHDTPARMLAVGVLRGIVPWRRARTFFVARLRRRLLEEELIGRIRAADASLTREGASGLLRRWLLAALEDDASTETPAGGRQEAGDGGGGAIGSEVNGAVLDARSPRELLLADDRRVLQWAASSAGGDFVSVELRSLAAGAKARQLQQLAAPSDVGADSGAASLIEGLKQLAASDPGLAAKMRAALAPPVRRLGDHSRESSPVRSP